MSGTTKSLHVVAATITQLDDSTADGLFSVQMVVGCWAERYDDVLDPGGREH